MFTVAISPGGKPVTVAPVAPPDNWYSIGVIARGFAATQISWVSDPEVIMWAIPSIGEMVIVPSIAAGVFVQPNVLPVKFTWYVYTVVTVTFCAGAFGVEIITCGGETVLSKVAITHDGVVGETTATPVAPAALYIISVIVSLSHIVGFMSPDTYTAEFGFTIIVPLTDELPEQNAPAVWIV